MSLDIFGIDYINCKLMRGFIFIYFKACRSIYLKHIVQSMLKSLVCNLENVQ